MDGSVLESFEYDPSNLSYSYDLTERAVGMSTLRVVATNQDDEEITADERDVFIINLGLGNR